MTRVTLERDQYHSSTTIPVISLVVRICYTECGRQGHLGNRSGKLEQTVRDLETSLRFSQHEIDKLKKENADLNSLLMSVENEDKRTQ